MSRVDNGGDDTDECFRFPYQRIEARVEQPMPDIDRLPIVCELLAVHDKQTANPLDLWR